MIILRGLGVWSPGSLETLKNHAFECSLPTFSMYYIPTPWLWEFLWLMGVQYIHRKCYLWYWSMWLVNMALNWKKHQRSNLLLRNWYYLYGWMELFVHDFKQSHFVPHHFITNKRIFWNYNQFSSWASPMQPRHLRAILHPASLLKSPYKPKGKIKAKKLHFAQKEPLI